MNPPDKNLPGTVKRKAVALVALLTTTTRIDPGSAAEVDQHELPY
jgi:hypothetical protein